MWSYGSSLSDEVTSAEFACINNDRYRNFVSGLHLQSITQRHHFHQPKSGSHRMHPKTQQQQQDTLRNNISNQQPDIRSLHQTHGYHIYHTNPDEQHQKLLLDQHNQLIGPDIFGVNVIPSNSEKYFSHNIECRNDDETFNLRHQDHLNIRSHPQKSRSDISTDDITNHLYIHHHNGHGIDVKYTPPHKSMYSFETHNLSNADVSFHNKRSAEDIYINKTSDAAEEDSGIVDCDREEIQRKRKKNLDYNNVEIKAEEDSEPELRNIGIPLRTKSY